MRGAFPVGSAAIGGVKRGNPAARERAPPGFPDLSATKADPVGGPATIPLKPSAASQLKKKTVSVGPNCDRGAHDEVALCQVLTLLGQELQSPVPSEYVLPVQAIAMECTRNNMNGHIRKDPIIGRCSRAELQLLKTTVPTDKVPNL